MNRQQFVEEFQKKLFDMFPDGFQHWWPNFIFHYSDINNVASILKKNILYSRSMAASLECMINDNADKTVISGTNQDYQRYVRLYFGAKTPTQYQNEGILQDSNIRNNAHCPVPVFLLFDFVKILSRPDSCFSNGNIAATNPQIYSDIFCLKDLEFKHIYSRAPLPETPQKRHINYCRNAEVLIPDSLEVEDYLEYVCVRSEAEKETLLSLLDTQSLSKYISKIRIFTKDGLFYRNRLYIEKVSLENQKIIIKIANASKGIFDLKIKSDLSIAKKEKISDSEWIIDFSENINSNGEELSIFLNGCLAYKGWLFPYSDIPF